MSNIEGSEPREEGAPHLKIRGAPMSLEKYLADPDVARREHEQLVAQFQSRQFPKATDANSRKGENDE